MNRLLTLSLLLCLPLLLAAAQISLSLDLAVPVSGAENSGWGNLSAPGYPQLPLKTINVILPADSENLSFTHQFSAPQNLSMPAPAVNPGFTDGERVLSAPARAFHAPQAVYQGLGHWGDVLYARFSVLPAVWDGSGWQAWQKLELNLTWENGDSALPNRVPPVLEQANTKTSSPVAGFFANPADLDKHYQPAACKDYDYLVISTPELYASITALEAFHQSQGMITSFTDISTILASSPGATAGEKLRNHLVSQYNSHPFSYLLLVGDQDLVPVMYLTPEPDGYETIPSDFFYGDLSSVVDTDGDSRLGEYSPADGMQDFLCDFTPEVFVGRISTNSATIAAQIAARTVAFEQTNAPWKHKALLPAAYLNYGGEPETIYLQTDGATFMEYAKATVLSGWQCTTMYERLGYIPSYPSDLNLDYNLLKNELGTNSYGILNWSAHGSSGSSSRKVWMSDDNSNNIPDGWEMQWMDMVDRQSFNNLVNQDGMIIFAASCYNGQIDANQPCLAEYALQNKAVNVAAATRTGWYKIGWATPGWGGLSSYNLHWLENITRNQLPVGAAHAYAGLTHTQYYLFGDPVDAGGIIYPELQNVYTNLLYGDPAVGHVGQFEAPLGEILVYEPFHHDGLPIVNALNSTGRFNVVYTEKMIPDYDYIDRFEAIFCLFGWGDTAYILHPDSLDYSLLNSYLANGGKLYLEGDVAWDPQDPFWGRFGTHAPLDNFAYIEGLQATLGGHLYTWDYDDLADPNTQILVPYTADAEALFSTRNTEHPDNTVGIFRGIDGSHATVASSFALASVQNGLYELRDVLGIILDRFGILQWGWVEDDDQLAPPASNSAFSYPNPFTGATSLRFDLSSEATVKLEIFNLRGQKVRGLEPAKLAKGSHELLWDGLDSSGQPVSAGVYLWRLDGTKSALSGKLLKLAK